MAALTSSGHHRRALRLPVNDCFWDIANDCAFHDSPWRSIAQAAYAIGSTADVVMEQLAAAHQRRDVHEADLCPNLMFGAVASDLQHEWRQG